MERAAQAYTCALNMLARRSRSEAELWQKLADKGFSREEVARTIDRLRELGYLDDRRLALQLAETLMRNRRMVGSRLRLELRKRRIPDCLVNEACAAAAAESDMATLVQEIVGSRYPRFDFATAPDREKRRVVGFLQRRGFPLAAIMEFFREK